jgi:hypothetical protein
VRKTEVTHTRLFGVAQDIERTPETEGVPRACSVLPSMAVALAGSSISQWFAMLMW